MAKKKPQPDKASVPNFLARETPPPKVDPISDALHRESAELGRMRAAGGRCTLDFATYFGKYPIAPDYTYGRHTRLLIEKLDWCTRELEAGRCVYLIINVPPRHGKSDICSRSYPPFHLCRNPDHEIMITTYASPLSCDLSIAARRRFEESGKDCGLSLSHERNQIEAWAVEGHRGGVYAVGLGGSVTGRGAHILLIDDYCKNRAEAESIAVRDSVWDAFQSDLMTRRAPVHAVIIVATRWHTDDLVGRIEERMQNDPNYPRFEKINLPAWDSKTGWLFPERFDAQWYESARSAVGSYGWECLYQGNPQPRGGAFLKVDKLQYIDKRPEGLTWHRCWDLASTEKERLKDDPDYTAGALVAVSEGKLFIADIRRGQWTAPTRDKMILQTVEDDPRGTRVKIETVAGYKDTAENLKARLNGRAVLISFRPDGDKISRAAIVEPYFEFGNVVLVRGSWNADFLSEAASFPRGKHDDQIDAVVGGAEEGIKIRKRFKLETWPNV